MKAPTIYDIAKIANTSTATVSRVLNNLNYPVTDELRTKVLEAAKALNYTPNLLGRQLKTNESRDIGVIIPNITNQYYPLLVLGVEDVARKRGYNVLLCNSYRDAETEKKYLQSLFQKRVKGVIVSSVSEAHDCLQELQASGLKVVAFEQDISLACNKINFDYYLGGYMAATHLLKLGHRRLAFVSAPLTKHSRRKVYEGFMKCVADHAVDLASVTTVVSESEEEVRNQVYEYHNGRNLARRLVEQGSLPTAIFCINDMTAFGVLQELARSNINVPRDVSVMGFDNIPSSEMVTPSLTTIDQCTYEMGSMAGDVLINNLEDKKWKNVAVLLQPTLIVRESTAEPCG